MQINSEFNNIQPNDSMFTYSVWVIWLNIAKFKIYLRYRYCSNLFRGMRRESEFWQHHCRNSTKVWERKRKKKMGERECMNFGNVISQIPVARSVCLSMCAVCSKWDMLKKKNQLWQYHCRNREEIFFFVAIMAMHCRNRGRKKNSGYGNLGRN